MTILSFFLAFHLISPQTPKYVSSFYIRRALSRATPSPLASPARPGLFALVIVPFASLYLQSPPQGC